jgi:hypothetical protein
MTPCLSLDLEEAAPFAGCRVPPGDDPGGVARPIHRRQHRRDDQRRNDIVWAFTGFPLL